MEKQEATEGDNDATRGRAQRQRPQESWTETEGSKKEERETQRTVIETEQCHEEGEDSDRRDKNQGDNDKGER